MDNEIFLNERVDVVARFGTGLNPCVPVKFRRATGREIIITEIGLRTPVANGRKTIHWFDEANRRFSKSRMAQQVFAQQRDQCQRIQQR